MSEKAGETRESSARGLSSATVSRSAPASLRDRVCRPRIQHGFPRGFSLGEAGQTDNFARRAGPCARCVEAAVVHEETMNLISSISAVFCHFSAHQANRAQQGMVLNRRQPLNDRL